jgi:hypothetical protein
MAAPVGAEFKQGQTLPGIDLGTGRGFSFTEVRFGRTHDRIVAHEYVNRPVSNLIGQGFR